MAKLLHAQLLVILASVVLVLSAGKPAVGENGRCGMSDEGAAACLQSIMTHKPPSEVCCSALKKADLPCLCGYKDSPMLKSLHIDPKQAMELPLKCKLTTSCPCK